MEAPKICGKCPLPIRGACPHMEWPEFANHEGPTYAFPGPSCPFVLLAAKDAEIEKLRGGYIDTYGTEETESWRVCIYCGENSPIDEDLVHAPDCILRAALKEVE